MSKVIGIDLGSTMSSVAVMENGKPTVIVNEEGSYGTPSVILLHNEDDVKVGNSAKRQQVVYPTETVRIIKRFMGATFDESSEAIKHVQYKVVNDNNKVKVEINGKTYTPEGLSALILKKMKQIAEDYLGEEVHDAVITVPAYFGDSARSATKLAGEMAGLNVKRVIPEPTAAILSSGLDMNKNAKYMVADFGGATLDFSVCEIDDGLVEILSTNGDVFLGGSNFDRELQQHLIKKFTEENNGVNLDDQALARFNEAAETAKIELSTSSSTHISLPYIAFSDGKPINFEYELSRAEFETIIHDFMDKFVKCAKEALRLANVNGNELDGILLVGGSCRIPLVQQRLKEINANLIKSANLDLAVAEGAAYQGAILGGEMKSDILLLDVTPLGYGIEVQGGCMNTLVEANTTIPCKKSEIFTTATDNQTAVTVKVLQGNRPMAADNKIVGIFNLEGILPAKRGVPQIEVSFDIDANGILNVTAKDKGTGKEQSVTIESSNTLSKEEIEKAKNDAEKYAEDDKKKKDQADKINKAQSLINLNKDSLETLSDKLTDDEKKKIEDYNTKLDSAISSKDLTQIESLNKEVEAFWNTFQMKNLNPNGQNGNPMNDIFNMGGNNGQTNTTNGENLQDADFEEVK